MRLMCCPGGCGVPAETATDKVHHRAKFMTGLRQRSRVSAFVARHASPPCGSRPGVKSHLEIMQLRRSLATSPFATGALRTTETTGRTLDQDQD
jgi:hypothetical protein